MKTLFASAALAAMLAGCAPSGLATRDSGRADEAPPARPVAASAVLAERDAGGDGATIIRRRIEGDVIRTWLMDADGTCCTEGRLPLARGR